MDLIAILLVALISMLMGFLLSTLIYNWRGKPGDERPKQAASPAGLQEGVRVWRVRRSGALSIEMDGQAFHAAGELSAGQRKRLAELAGALPAWLGASPAGPEAGPPSAHAAQASTVFQEPSVERQPSGTDALKSILRPGVEENKVTQGSSKSIAAQIDEILQSNLENTYLADRSIRLMELPGQGMVVMVGLEKYTEVEAVPDPLVRAAIQTAVAEWEARQNR